MRAVHLVRGQLEPRAAVIVRIGFVISSRLLRKKAKRIGWEGVKRRRTRFHLLSVVSPDEISDYENV